MKKIRCERDGEECNLNVVRKRCRHMTGSADTGEWQGKCADRKEYNEVGVRALKAREVLKHKERKKVEQMVVSIHPIQDPDKDTEVD